MTDKAGKPRLGRSLVIFFIKCSICWYWCKALLQTGVFVTGAKGRTFNLLAKWGGQSAGCSLLLCVRGKS